MTVIAKEIYGVSESGTVSEEGARTINRVFHVYDDDETAPELSLDDALDVTTLVVGDTTETFPIIGDEIVDATFTFPCIYRGERQYSRVTGHRDLWQITLVYTSIIPQGAVESEQEVSGGVRAVTKGFYRRGELAKPDSWDDPQGFVGGYPVDLGGTKTSLVFPQATLSIRKYTLEQPGLGNFTSLIGTRNSDGFQNATIGSVLFTGLRFSQDTRSQLWTMEYEFSFDPISYHAEQVAKCDITGKVICFNYLTANNDYISVAEHVYWIQPFPVLSNFQQMINGFSPPSP